jgi:hypothetical protein
MFRTTKIEGDAVFDKSRRYRYSLSRFWNRELDKAVFIMLNPSKADADINDPTIRRCISFAQKMGCGSLEVVNLFAFRTAYPEELRACRRPVGKLNDQYICSAAESASLIVVAWGNWGYLHRRNEEVLKLLSGSVPVHCFGTTLKGHPRHPLFLPSEISIIELPR